MRPPTAPSPTTADLHGRLRATTAGEGADRPCVASSQRLSCKIARSFDFFGRGRPGSCTVSATVNSLVEDPATWTPPRQATPRPRSLVKGRQTRVAILDAALALASHIGLEGLSIGALAEVTGHEQVGRFRPLRLPRGTSDLGRARVPREVRGRGVFPGACRAARPAAPAGPVRPLAEARLDRGRFGLHLHQRRRRVRRPAGPGPRRARDDGADLAAGARAGDPLGCERRVTCVPTPTRSRSCSRSMASFSPSTTTRASCAMPVRKSAPALPSNGSSSIGRHRRRPARTV